MYKSISWLVNTLKDGWTDEPMGLKLPIYMYLHPSKNLNKNVHFMQSVLKSSHAHITSKSLVELCNLLIYKIQIDIQQIMVIDI